MKTISIKKSQIDKVWWVADAEGQILGRFASKISQILRGKHKPDFTPHMNMGDFVIIINAENCVNPDYINESVNLFLDSVNLFTNIYRVNDN